jgi:GDP-4-dehydro-6-deoxy-D-mannose reductase
MIAHCAEQGDEVHATERPGETGARDSRAHWCAADLLEPAGLSLAIERARPEGIVHLAGQANVAAAHADPAATFRANAEGTLRLLDAAKRAAPHARVLVVTSAEVYGAVPADEQPITERTPLRPTSPYGVSKAAADLVAEGAARAGQHVVRMRPFNHIGPGQRPGFIAPDVASQVAAIERGEREPVLRVGNLSAARDFTDVRDVVRAYRLALDRGASGAAYNVASGVATPIESIVRFFVERARVPIRLEIEASRLRPSDVPVTRGDASKAAVDLGWTPRIPLERSLGDVLEEWRAGERAVAGS